MTTFDPTKKYRTRDGREFELKRVREDDFGPVFIEGRIFGDDRIRSWLSNCSYFSNSNQHHLDLIEVTEESAAPDQSIRSLDEYARVAYAANYNYWRFESARGFSTGGMKSAARAVLDLAGVKYREDV